MSIGRTITPPARANGAGGSPGPVLAPSLVFSARPSPWLRGVLLVGPPKVGKTTFAGGAPKPVFVQADDAGISVLPDDIPHAVPTAWDVSPGSNPNEPTVIGLVRSLVEGDHDYRTIVIDTVNRCELLLWRWICRMGQVDSIAEYKGGWGAGYNRALEETNRLIDLLHRAKRERGMHWIAISHQSFKTAKDATQDDYERAAMQLNEKAAGAWEGAADSIIYAQPELQTFDHLNKDKGKEKGERRKVDITGRTVALVRPGRGINAGSRDLVPSPMILSWPEYETQAKRGAEIRKKVYQKRAALSLEEQAALDSRLAVAGFSLKSHESEIES